MNNEKASIISNEFAKFLKNEFPETYSFWYGRNFATLSIKEVTTLSNQTGIAFNELVVSHRVGTAVITIDEMINACQELGQGFEIGQFA